MSAAEYGRIVADMAKGFPCGAKVWHRANGKRGVVIGYEVRYQGNSFVILDCGGAGPSAEYAMCLSLEPVPEPCAGDEWKESA